MKRYISIFSENENFNRKLYKSINTFVQENTSLCSSSGNCDSAAYLLDMYLYRNGFDAKVVEGQFKAKDGYHWHYWVVVKDKIIDVSTEQFGIKGPVITSLSDDRYISDRSRFVDYNQIV